MLLSGTSIFVSIVEISLIFIENRSYELSESAKRESTSAVYDEIRVVMGISGDSNSGKFTLKDTFGQHRACNASEGESEGIL